MFTDHADSLKIVGLFSGSMTTYLSTIEHNKRCCLAYT